VGLRRLLIGEAIRGRRHDAVIHSKSGSPRDGSSDAVRGGGDPRYLRQTCEESLKNLGIETLDVFCMSRVDPNVPIEESVGGMAELVKEGKTRFISLSECSAQSLRRGSAVHPLVFTQPRPFSVIQLRIRNGCSCPTRRNGWELNDMES
jgi:aryl-alcohol dehydrogenase-like predicted oxidoreductase